MKNINLKNTVYTSTDAKVDGEFVEIHNEKFYKISNYNRMPDFFMTIISDSDHWMYLSSNGSLTAGRKNRDNAFFPYYTDDKIHDYIGKTGSKTICLVEKDDKTYLWEPFSDESEKVYNIERNLAKSIYGNKIIFEERNFDLGVCFQYGWYNSEKFGWIKKSSVQNIGESNLKIELLDGLQNILPYGVDYAFQNEYSNLLDAYKKSELLVESKLGLFMLSSIPVDRAEPSEALKTTSVWSLLPVNNANYLVSNKQIEKFRTGTAVQTEFDVRASRGAYFVNIEFDLKTDEEQEWYLVAEINQDACDIANLDHFIKTNTNIVAQLNEDILKGTDNLIEIVANADGLQLGNEALGFARHFSNTLFNIMRGGVFTGNYTIDASDFRLYIKQTNKKIDLQFAREINELSAKIDQMDLLQWAKKIGNPDLERICYEYLPITFSRRHGDPSRPWNQFSIETKNEDGSDKLNYQGNWRDIFQNWEALSLSYPEYIEGIIAKFVNASTADGYNPYRITRNGMDWECPDPEDPWAYIGYWGDHQIIYLAKLLEISNKYHPGKLDALLISEIFTYANVPYRIKSYTEIVKNPQDTIQFDFELNENIKRLSTELGADARLLPTLNGGIYHVNLTEKILATLLSKLSNFIPETGIWLNTQRPEWNDANNALVGNGVSMVTLYYLRRFLNFWIEKFDHSRIDSFSISEEIVSFLNSISSVFNENIQLLETGFSDTERLQITNELGSAGSNYRNTIYSQSFSGEKKKVHKKDLVQFLNLSLKYIDQAIDANRRKDGLYHAYNLISFKNQGISIRYLYEMLEGQVAALSSGALSTNNALEVLDALKQSKLFRENQYSYILYPDRQLPRFVEKNNVPSEQVEKSELLKTLLTDNYISLIKKDNLGNYHFNSSFRNAELLSKAIDNLDAEKYGNLVQQEKTLVLAIYETMFDHQSFTGRSGTFYGYEGLGSIYWHMVSKLLLVTQECFFKAVKESASEEILGRFKEHYYEIKAGIGLYKSPKLYGAFPTDAYSHTPANAGAKQPGLTGQVKEDVISRMGELGVFVENGQLNFNLSLLNRHEYLENDTAFKYINLAGEKKEINLKKGELAYTICQVPVIYKPGNQNQILVSFTNGSSAEFTNNTINKEISAMIFSRNGEVDKIEMYILNQ